MNIFRATKAENVECENQAKFVQERIIYTEEKLVALCAAFAAYLQKNFRMRDATDVISSTIHQYAVDESINKSLKSALVKLAELMAIIGDLRESELLHIEQGVIKEFLQYNTLCRNAKSEVRSIFNVKERELSRRRHLGKVRLREPQNRKIILKTKAEIELSKAAAASSQVQRELEEHIEIFERKKLADVKTILMEFVMAQIRFHGEALEVFTEAYKTIMKINLEEDIQSFREILKQSPSSSRIEVVKKNMGDRTSVNTSYHHSNISEDISISKIPAAEVVNSTSYHQEAEIDLEEKKLTSDGEEDSVEEETSEECTSDESSDETDTKISCDRRIK